MNILCDFTCSAFHNFVKIKPEMKKILLFILSTLFCISSADSAVRDDGTVSRQKNTAVPVRSARSITSRTPLKNTIPARATKTNKLTLSKNTTKNVATRTSVRATTNQNKNVSARAASINNAENVAATETRIGTEYEQCKAAFFTCMDQFCQLKNDSFRRCSCNDKVFDLQSTSETYQSINEKLAEFNENLDVVGMSKDQAIATKTASEGENALTEDKSASRQLLQAIMNAIKGEDATVGGKHKDLNSINLSADFSNAFGIDDYGQIIASYNGSALYKAVYPTCKDTVKADCNSASLQRAINAYLMAIEQDCNTVESALQKQKKALETSVTQSSAMLDLARVENRKKHNADNVATCLTNIEKSIQSEEVCGTDYHRCLDYGQFIDINTGAPLTGVSDFYKLGEILTFKTGTELKDQKLSSIQSNRTFVQFFENKTKKFAKDSLDKCTEDADFVWQQYLDRALIDIYYAQQAKVKTIKQSCLDLVAKCYANQNVSITAAIANLTGDTNMLLKPTTVSLTTQLCYNYIESCNSMFGEENIIQTYIANKDSTDSINACRAIAEHCFESFGGEEYNNLYYTQSGLFKPGQAMDWFSLYEYNTNSTERKILSPCAQQVANTSGCEDVLEEVFGGFDKYIDSTNNKYAYIYTDAIDDISNNSTSKTREIRPMGIATEIYQKIIDNLTKNCAGLGGYFVEYKYAETYGYKPDDFCKIDSNSNNGYNVFHIDPAVNQEQSLVYWYHFVNEENVCPANYSSDVDTQSWGMCSCWENGGQRSKNGTATTCRPLLPSLSDQIDPICSEDILCSANTTDSDLCDQPRSPDTISRWCQQTVFSNKEQVCPTTRTTVVGGKIFCADENNNIIDTVKYNVPKRISSEQ